MKIDVLPQNPIEWLLLNANVIPKPLLHGQIGLIYSRAVLMGFKFEIFEAVKDQPASAEQIAEKTRLNLKALKSLLGVLTAGGYLKFDDGKFTLTAMSKKWCLKDSPQSVYHQQMFLLLCWDWVEQMDEFLQTGKGIQYHDNLSDEQWYRYQLGMGSIAKASAEQARGFTPMPPNASLMLDIGGAHGLYSVELCKKYPSLKAIVLDLPQAVEKSEPLIAQHGLGDRVKYWAADALEAELGVEKYDFILISSLMHHFTAEQNIALSRRVARALKPGGYFAIQEILRPELSSNMEMMGTVLDLFFNLSSTAGNWSLEELKNFQAQAGLRSHKVKNFNAPPGFVQITAKKEK